MSNIPDSVKKALQTMVTETVESAVSSRPAAPAQTVIVAKAAPELTGAQKMGMRLKADYLKSFGQNDRKMTAKQKAFIEKAGANAGTAATGGNLVEPEFSDEIIAVLREQSVLLAAGAQLYTYDGPTLTIGKLNTGVTLGWVAEGGAPSGSTIDAGQVVLGSKHLAGYVQASNQLLRQSSLDAASMLSQDIMSALSEEVDAKFLDGAGTGNLPLGITGQLDAGQTVAITATPDVPKIRKDLAAAVKRVRVAKIMTKGSAFIMPPAEFYNLLGMTDGSGALAFPTLGNEQPSLLGFPVYVTSALTDKILFVQPAHVAYGVCQDASAGMGLNGTDLVSDSTTVFGRFIGDVKVKHNKCAAVITGTSAWV